MTPPGRLDAFPKQPVITGLKEETASRNKKSETVNDLDAIYETNGEIAHADAETILLRYCHPDVRAAYQRVKDRASFWAFA